MRIGSSIPAFLLHASSWVLFLAAAMMVVLAVGSALDLGPEVGSSIVDMIAAAICFALALVVRSVAHRLEQVI